MCGLWWEKPEGQPNRCSLPLASPVPGSAALCPAHPGTNGKGHVGAGQGLRRVTKTQLILLRQKGENSCRAALVADTKVASARPLFLSPLSLFLELQPLTAHLLLPTGLPSAPKPDRSPALAQDSLWPSRSSIPNPEVPERCPGLGACPSTSR